MCCVEEEERTYKITLKIEKKEGLGTSPPPSHKKHKKRCYKDMLEVVFFCFFLCVLVLDVQLLLVLCFFTMFLVRLGFLGFLVVVLTCHVSLVMFYVFLCISRVYHFLCFLSCCDIHSFIHSFWDMLRQNGELAHSHVRVCPLSIIPFLCCAQHG